MTRALPTLVMALSALTTQASALDWPARPAAVARDADPIAPVRWDALSAWTSPGLPNARLILARLDVSPDDRPSRHAMRAVLLRVLGREDDARRALQRAFDLSPDLSPCDDPDVALTAAWLAARHGDWAVAADMGQRALSRMTPQTTGREVLVLEVARWSMARGPEGLDRAAALLRGFIAVSPASPMVRATLALALARQGRTDDARALVMPARTLLEPFAGDWNTSAPDATVRGEGAAAVGVALTLAGRGREAVEPLARSVAQGLPAWRRFQETWLAQARRAGPAIVTSSASGGVLQVNIPGIVVPIDPHASLVNPWAP